MTVISDFDIATDLKVEFFLAGGGNENFIIGVSLIGGENTLAGAGVFTIGFSLLDGADVLGGEDYGFVWTDLTCTTSRASIQIGGSVRDQLYFQPESAKANVTLQTWDYDPSQAPAFRPGVKMRIRLLKDSINQILYQGIVESISGTYDVDGNNLLQVSALDSFNNLMNTRLVEFDSTTDYPAGYVTPYEQLAIVAQGFGTAMHPDSSDPNGEIPSTILTNVIPSTLVYDAIQIGVGLFWIDPATEKFVFVERRQGAVPADTPIIGNHHDDPNHLCMTDITTSLSANQVYNSLKIALRSDSETSVLRENQDSIDLYGYYAQDVTLNVTGEDELNRWADEVFVATPTSVVDSVDTKTINRLGELTEAAFMSPGQTVGIHYSHENYEINDYYTITRVSHDIDPNNWFTTLNLWREN